MKPQYVSGDFQFETDVEYDFFYGSFFDRQIFLEQEDGSLQPVCFEEFKKNAFCIENLAQAVKREITCKDGGFGFEITIGAFYGQSGLEELGANPDDMILNIAPCNYADGMNFKISLREIIEEATRFADKENIDALKKLQETLIVCSVLTQEALDQIHSDAE